MRTVSDETSITVGTLVEEETRFEFPVIDVLTGRGFVTGKSGSGKSNTTSVIVEKLLDSQYPVLVVDSDGEYYGLKEEYEMLHAGADEECDIQVSAEHAEKIAGLALEQNVPTILDVSGYLDEGEADELVRETARHLFAKEKKLKKPFLLVIEECHEYIPEGGGMNETGKMLIKVGKRGRKHGLGIVGISQRPADVKKDFITQANWLVWHRLTWENDTKVVGRIVGGEYGEAVPNLNAGEAFVQCDWTDEGVRRVQFDRKRTFDAGATPGLDDFERPELKSVSDALVDDLQEISQIQEQEENRVAELESRLERKDERIAELEAELRQARDISAAARKLANAFSHGDPVAPTGDVEERFRRKNEELRELRETVDELEATLDERQADLSAFETDDEEDDEGAYDERSEYERHIDELQEQLRRRGEALRRAEAARSDEGSGAGAEPAADDRAERRDGDELLALAHADAVAARITAARRESQCNDAHAWNVVDVLAMDGPLTAHEIEPRVDVSLEAVHSLLSALRSRSLVRRDGDRRYALNPERMERLADHRAKRTEFGELEEQWRD